MVFVSLFVSFHPLILFISFPHNFAHIQVNLHAPEIYVQALPDILENSNANIYGIVRVEDKDIGIHGRIKSLSIVDGDPDGHFRIRPTANPAEYNIEVHRLLDREKTPSGYNLTLHAVDSGTPPQQSYKVVPVRLSDINDNGNLSNHFFTFVVVVYCFYCMAMPAHFHWKCLISQ